ncbi:pathogen-related protein-like [Tripterygium wilfordii]|uniref:Pathogen-related protein-like n=1 Tax=Tripterygium wilfordii TaxID=458696 RepID=A0A7J7C9E1_TRIWF|nr:pathogen-related protein-like [Tripterygium wilfordii]
MATQEKVETLAKAVEDMKVVGDKYRMAKRVTRRNRSKCCEIMGDGTLSQDLLTILQNHKPRKIQAHGLTGSYNALLKNSSPDKFKFYKPDEETFESSHDAFQSAFPRGFAWEVISVYSGLSVVVAYKFRHWGYFEGSFKGHALTGDMVEFYGVGIMKVDESMRAEDVEIYYDPG